LHSAGILLSGNEIFPGHDKFNIMSDTKDLSQKEGIEKMKELAEGAKICHFVTGLSRKPLSSRPMATQEVDDEGNFWFLSKRSSNKNEDIDDDPEVQLFYSNHGSSEYLTVFGYAEMVRDRNKLEELWSPIAKAWFTEGKDDPELTIIRVRPVDAYYWDTKTNKLVSLIKIATGALTGKTMDDGIEGKISL
jgi:general stress protein 26